jgi:RNA polymerase-binding transcription factor DksA
MGPDAYKRLDAPQGAGGAMEDTKDRLGQRLHEREQAEEDRFFARKDREALERLRAEQGSEIAKAALGHCPRCGTQLDAIKLYGVQVLQCPADCGHWLDKGEIELIAKREQNSWMGRIFYRPKLEE